MTLGLLVFSSLFLGLLIGTGLRILRKTDSSESGAVPIHPDPPPVRKSALDHQIEALVEEVMQSIQQMPEKWTTWGIYSKGWGDKATNFEIKNPGEIGLGISINPEGILRYRSYRKKDENDEREACHFELPINDYDQNRLREAFAWLAAQKARNLLSSFAEEETTEKEKPDGTETEIEKV